MASFDKTPLGRYHYLQYKHHQGRYGEVRAEAANLLGERLAIDTILRLTRLWRAAFSDRPDVFCQGEDSCDSKLGCVLIAEMKSQLVFEGISVDYRMSMSLYCLHMI